MTRSRRTRRPGDATSPLGPCALSNATDPARGRSVFLPATAVGLLAFVLYVPGFGNSFAYDAEVVVEGDARVHTLQQPVRLIAASYWGFDEDRLALYRPVVTLSFAIDWAVYGGRPWGFHQTNALAHAMASVLVLLLLTGFVAMPAAVAGAAVFAAHPVHVEAVANIVGRADIFAAGFLFAAMLAWSRLQPRGVALLLTVPLLFLLALGAKESAVMLPALLILFDGATGRLRRACLREWLRDRAVPLLALGLVGLGYLAVRMMVLGTLAPLSINPAMEATEGGADRLRTALQIWPEILRLMVFPRVLLADYGPRVLMPTEAWTPQALAGPLLLGAAVLGGVCAFLRGRGGLGLALLWTPVALLPVSNLMVPIGVLLAERTLYVAVFAVALGLALVVDSVRVRWPERMRLALGFTAVACFLFAARTVLRLPSWESTDQVFRTLLRERPDSYRAQWHFARMAWRDRELDLAAQHYRAAISLWPHAPPVYAEAGMFAMEEGLEREARTFAELALEQWPDDPAFLRRLAVACLNLNDTAAARSAVERGLRAVPDDPLFLAIGAVVGVYDPR